MAVQVKPLILPTQQLINTEITYKWHQFDSKSNPRRPPLHLVCPCHLTGFTMPVGCGSVGNYLGVGLLWSPVALVSPSI